MKKLATLLLAAGMVLGSFAGAEAIDWKVKGNWQFEFAVTDGLGFMKNVGRGTQGFRFTNVDHRRTRAGNGLAAGRDNFSAMQRINLVLEAVASESLSGTLQFEIGTTHWGDAYRQGASVGANDRRANGAMGQRGVNVGVRQAYLDWIMPSTDLRIRMGIQRIDTPSFTFGPSVFGEDVAGIVASYKFNDNVSLVAFWARPYNDNYITGDIAGPDGATNQNRSAYMDNVDAFGLVLPLSFDGFKVTPWGMIGAIGPNAFRSGNVGTTNASHLFAGMFPQHWQTRNWRASPAGGNAWLADRHYATAWWAGLTGEITALDPFRFAWEATYGSVAHDNVGYLNRHGWYINALAEYKLDWGVPGLYFWWGSGDNSNPKDGSERMPVFSVQTANNNMLSTFGFSGSPSVGGDFDGIFGSSAYTGTWGIGARIRDMSFIEDLKHTIRVNFMGGTNDPTMAKYMTGKKAVPGRVNAAANTDFMSGSGLGGAQLLYLTTQDYGIEVNFDSVYKIYENFEVMLELGYIHLWLDQSRSVWGASGPGMHTLAGIRGVNYTDAFKAQLIFRYSF